MSNDQPQPIGALDANAGRGCYATNAEPEHRGDGGSTIGAGERQLSRQHAWPEIAIGNGHAFSGRGGAPRLGAEPRAVTAVISARTAKDQSDQARSALLPQIPASLGATETQIDLAALGLSSISLPKTGAGLAGFSFPSIVGPFHYVQAQGNLSWNALNLTALRNWQVNKEAERGAQFSQRDARELIVLAVGGTYLQTVAAPRKWKQRRRKLVMRRPSTIKRRRN